MTTFIHSIGFSLTVRAKVIITIDEKMVGEEKTLKSKVDMVLDDQTAEKITTVTTVLVVQRSDTPNGLKVNERDSLLLQVRAFLL